MQQIVMLVREIDPDRSQILELTSSPLSLSRRATVAERERYCSLARILAQVGVGLVLKQRGSSLVVHGFVRDSPSALSGCFWKHMQIQSRDVKTRAAAACACAHPACAQRT